MNWFERYAIPGIYFTSLSTAICFIFKNSLPENGIIFSAFVGSLSSGYVFSIISQRIHYCFPPSWFTQRNAWLKAFKIKLTEVKAESMAVNMIRRKINCHNECGEWIRE